MFAYTGGLKGEQGVQGDEGDAGVQGEQGVQGDAGIQGIQGIQGVQGEQGASGSAGYVDRGDDATAFDFQLSGMTIDGAYHDMDLSGISGAGRRLVHIRVSVSVSTPSLAFNFRTKGNSSVRNTFQRSNMGTGVLYRYDGWVYTDANGEIEYNFNTGTYVAIEVLVRGWLVLSG